MGKRSLAGISLRLTEDERELLKIFNAALKVSEYTDDVDNARMSYRRDEVMLNSMIELFTTLAGLSVISNDLPPKVREQLKVRNPQVNILAPVLQKFFEIGRRFKRMNPDKMRSEYGKMVMLLQDAARPGVKRSLEMELLVPIKTVGDALKAVGAAEMLADDSIGPAVAPLPPGYTDEQLARKNKAMADLMKKYGTDESGAEFPAKAKIVDLAVRSISDAIGHIDANRELVRKMINWLDSYFGSGAPKDDKHNLTITRGAGGSCLSHTHSSQFNYVKEALTLWDIVQRDIFSFWSAVEEDMLVTNAEYRMMNTGQGVHRVSAGPKTRSLMQSAVAEADQAMGGWVGIKVVHMGDQDVPNPLVFIDKYTIIPRLIAPIVHTIEEVELEFGIGVSARSIPKEARRTEKYPGYRELLLSGHSGPEDVVLTILRDFYRHGFDGSGDDGGSCIDGRLTSAWNWCSELHKKPYYQVFQLTGFVGFDSNYGG